MTAWVTRFAPPPVQQAGRLLVAVKDAIDMAGVVTTAGCVAVREQAVPAASDAACLAGGGRVDRWVFGTVGANSRPSSADGGQRPAGPRGDAGPVCLS